jgi:hypothetical protein
MTDLLPQLLSLQASFLQQFPLLQEFGGEEMPAD